MSKNHLLKRYLFIISYFRVFILFSLFGFVLSLHPCELFLISFSLPCHSSLATCTTNQTAANLENKVKTHYQKDEANKLPSCKAIHLLIRLFSLRKTDSFLLQCPQISLFPQTFQYLWLFG